MKLSIIIPTRNRVNLIKEKLDNLYLELKTKENLSVIICDNASNDGTRKFCTNFIKKKSNFFYHRSSRWVQKEKFILEWSTKFIRGDFFLFLFDDDYLISSKLTFFLENVFLFKKTKLISFNRSLVLTDKIKNHSIKIPKFDSKIYKYEARKHLKFIFDNNKIFTNTPMVTNSIIEKKLYLKLKKKYKKLSLYGHMGDYTLSVMLLNEIKYFYYINYPLVLFREWKDNTSVQIHHKKTTMPEYKKWIISFDKYIRKCPIKFFLWSNCTYIALNGTAKKIKSSLKVSEQGYLKSLFIELDFLKKLNDKKYMKIFNYFNLYLKEKKINLIKNGFNEYDILNDFESANFYKKIQCISINGRVTLNSNERKIFIENLKKGQIKIGIKIFKLYYNFLKQKLASLLKIRFV